MFALLGVFGQTIFVAPTSRLVMVHRQATGSNAEAIALWHTLVAHLGGRQ